MNIDERYYVREVMNNKDSAEFWQSANESLAQRVYKQVKQETPAAKLYIFSGVQVITINQAPVSYTHLDVYKRQMRYCVPLRMNSVIFSPRR